MADAEHDLAAVWAAVRRHLAQVELDGWDLSLDCRLRVVSRLVILIVFYCYKLLSGSAELTWLKLARAHRYRCTKSLLNILA